MLDRHLAERDYIARDYSIADIARYPWIVPHEGFGLDLADFPRLNRWFGAITARPAVKRAYDGVADADAAPLSAEASRVLFQHGASE